MVCNISLLTCSSHCSTHCAQAVWVDQLYRTITGDRLYHNHSEEIEDVALAVLSGVINRTAGVTDLPLSVFDVPDISVCSGTCYVTESEVELSDG